MATTTTKVRPTSTTNGHDVLIDVPKPEIRLMRVTIVGDAPLICHRFSEKAQNEMLDKQMKKAKSAKEAKDPEALFRASLYPMPGERDQYGFPATAFKSSAVDACSHIDGVTKVVARGAFHIVGDMVKISGEPTMRQDTVRIGMGKTDIRFRAEFREWSADVLIRYNARVITPEQIIHLLNTAGFAIGVGEWRPQKDGSFGMFHVAPEVEV
jgi:hypothetical protein